MKQAVKAVIEVLAGFALIPFGGTKESKGVLEVNGKDPNDPAKKKSDRKTVTLATFGSVADPIQAHVPVTPEAMEAFWADYESEHGLKGVYGAAYDRVLHYLEGVRGKIRTTLEDGGTVSESEVREMLLSVTKWVEPSRAFAPRKVRKDELCDENGNPLSPEEILAKLASLGLLK